MVANVKIVITSCSKDGGVVELVSEVLGCLRQGAGKGTGDRL